MENLFMWSSVWIFLTLNYWFQVFLLKKKKKKDLLITDPQPIAQKKCDTCHGMGLQWHWTKGWHNELMSGKCVCRTAPATPGLLNFISVPGKSSSSGSRNLWMFTMLWMFIMFIFRSSIRWVFGESLLKPQLKDN